MTSHAVRYNGEARRGPDDTEVLYLEIWREDAYRGLRGFAVQRSDRTRLATGPEPEGRFWDAVTAWAATRIRTDTEAGAVTECSPDIPITPVDLDAVHKLLHTGRRLAPRRGDRRHVVSRFDA